MRKSCGGADCEGYAGQVGEHVTADPPHGIDGEHAADAILLVDQRRYLAKGHDVEDNVQYPAMQVIGLKESTRNGRTRQRVSSR